MNSKSLPPIPEQLRPEFVRFMADELVANAPRKGDFSKLVIPASDVRPWMNEHVEKLYTAVERGDRAAVREYTADIANIAMKVEECHGPDSGKKL